MAGDPLAALARALREDRGRILAAVMARTGDMTLAEDALQEAALSAHIHWARHGPPDRPAAWLIRVAFRKAIDRLRGAARDAGQRNAMAILARDEATEDPEVIPDDRLRLIFTCCHPALDAKSQVALTLRMVGGLTTPEIAAAFLDEPATMGQRISRAKARIGAARIPFAVPDPEEWNERLRAVLAVIYLIFNAGYSAAPDPARDLCEEAIFLARLIDRLRPGEAEVEGALALMLLTHARRAARVAEGATVPPSAQERGRWDHAAIAEGRALIDRAMARGAPGPYQIKAAISALHCAEGPTDWPQIAALYAALAHIEPTPVVRLNHAVAVAEAGEPRAALNILDTLEGVQDYQPYHAARAMVLARLSSPAARDAYDRAIALATTEADARFLREKQARLPG
jgi:predicted RNA polymerase sigma factor